MQTKFFNAGPLTERFYSTDSLNSSTKLVRLHPKPHTISSSLQSSFSLMGPLNKSTQKATKAKGMYITVESGTRYVDGGGLAGGVTCIGHGNKRVIKAIANQYKTGLTYLSSL